MAIGPNQAVTGSPLGYITSSGFVHVYQINNVFSVAHTDFSRAFVEYYENNSFTQKTIYMWGPLLYRVTTPIEATEYYPSDRDFDSDPQAEKGLYGYNLLVPAKMNSIKTDIGVRARPPRVNNVISRNDIGDPNYYPGEVAGITPYVLQEMLLELQKGALHPGDRQRIIDALDKWAKPGSPNRMKLKNMGIPLV